MPRKEYEPWFAVKVGARKNRKIIALPNDTARLGWFLGVMAEAKMQRPGGRFDSRDQLAEVIPGRFAEWIDAYLEVGLLEEAPAICPRCKKHVGEVPDGTLLVHDWRDHQRDPDAAIRVAEWRRERDEGASTTDVRPAYDGSTTDESSIERPTYADSRARARTRETETGDRDRTERDSPQPPSRAAARGRSSRAAGTNPRAIAAAGQARVDAEAKAIKARRQRRRNAYYGGLITEAQLEDMNRRDAPLEELPTPPAMAWAAP